MGSSGCSRMLQEGRGAAATWGVTGLPVIWQQLYVGEGGGSDDGQQHEQEGWEQSQQGGRTYFGCVEAVGWEVRATSQWLLQLCVTGRFLLHGVFNLQFKTLVRWPLRMRALRRGGLDTQWLPLAGWCVISLPPLGLCSVALSLFLPLFSGHLVAERYAM